MTLFLISPFYTNSFSIWNKFKLLQTAKISSNPMQRTRAAADTSDIHHIHHFLQYPLVSNDFLWGSLQGREADKKAACHKHLDTALA